MFSIRQLAAGTLAAVTLAVSAPQALAQKPSDPTNAENVGKATVVDNLGEQLRNQFKVINTYGTGEKRSFTAPNLQYYASTIKQSVGWGVDFNVITIKDRAPLVRMHFNCQTLPKNVDSARLQAMMEWSGDHPNAVSYFKTAKIKEGLQLYIVADYPSEIVDKLDWRKEVDAVFAMADSTQYLWNGDLSKPLSTAETKTESTSERMNISGLWDGKVFINDDEVGQYSIQFMSGGLVIGSRARKGDTQVSMLTGTYTLDGNKLTIEYKDVEKPETYDVTLKGKSLTLTNKKGNDTLSIKMTKGQ